MSGHTLGRYHAGAKRPGRKEAIRMAIVKKIDGFGETVLTKKQATEIARSNSTTIEVVREIEKRCRQRYISEKRYVGLSKQEYRERIFNMVDINASPDIRAFKQTIVAANESSKKVTERVGKYGTGYAIIEDGDNRG
jgi:hypothetical protein